MINLRSLPLCALASAFICSAAALAQQAAPAARIVNPIDESQLVTLKGNVNPHANAKNDRGPVSPAFALPDLTLVLSRGPEQQAAFDAFVSSQYDSGSPNFHQWLTPAQIGAQFGPAQADIATITGWLSSHGFAIRRVAPDQMTIRFSGTAAQVESAFHTEIDNLSVNGVPHYANMSDPQIPAALATVVVGVKALHNFLPRPLHRLGSKVQFNKEAGKWQRIGNTAAANSSRAGSAPSLTTLGAASKPALNPRPLFGINGDQGTQNAYLEEDVTPWDFATIYNVLPLWNASPSINGTGQTIGIAGTSFINIGKNGGPNDVATYRSAFGLPAGLTPNEIDTGDGPAATICTSQSSTSFCGLGDLEENSLDVEASGAVATGAQIDLVVTGQNSQGTIDTLYDSASYIVDNLTARILNVSYGECELGQGTAENVAYYDLWQSAATEGISVFVATSDAGSAACDDGLDQDYGNPYVAQYGLSVNGIASTPFNTAVGGTDFSWCQPYYDNNGNFQGCPSSSTSQGSPAYWNTSNNATTGESAAGYVPEIPWNDACENPIWAKFIETILNVSGEDSFYGVNPTTPEEACSVVYNYWSNFDSDWENAGDGDPYFEYFVDTIGGGGGASNCVVNSTNPNSTTGQVGTCSTGATSTGTSYGSISLYNDGWVKPSWQTGVSGIPNDGVRDVPDVVFFAGDGALESATLICVSNLGACTYSDTTEPTAQEVGGTSVGTPEMAGVMALINQKAGAAQGLANPQLYQLAGMQTYSECSAETVTNSSSCFFQAIDQGTNTMPCNLTGTQEGGASGQAFAGIASPNCTAINSGDTIGTLVSSGTTPAYNAAASFDLATGLGSLNVANVVNHWVSDVGTATATMNVTLSATTIPANTDLTVTVTMTGSGNLGTPTGSVTAAGGGYSANQPLTAGAATITIPANSMAPGSVTLTVTYSGDSNYASTSQQESITVQALVPRIQILALASDNVQNPVNVTVEVSAPAGATTVPTGTVSLDNSTAVALTSSGTASFTIPAGTLAVGNDTLTANYNSTSSEYVSGTQTAAIDIVGGAPLTPTITVTPGSNSVDTAQSLDVSVSVTGSGATQPTGSVTLSGGTYTFTAILTGGALSFTIPGNSLTAGTATLTAAYGGDAAYLYGSNTAQVSVAQSVYSLSASTPTAVSPGGSATSTITGSTSSTDYSGTVTLNSCTLKTSPSGAVSLPTCSVTGTITYSSGSASGSGTATVYTTTASSSALIRPNFGNGKGWLGAGSSAVLALLIIFGIPARRRSWRSMLCILVAIVALGALSSCGGNGGGGGGGGGTPATTAGSYTFTVQGAGNDPASTTESTTFTLTVN